jgi:hypothetical protein
MKSLVNSKPLAFRTTTSTSSWHNALQYSYTAPTVGPGVVAATLAPTIAATTMAPTIAATMAPIRTAPSIGTATMAHSYYGPYNRAAPTGTARAPTVLTTPI